MSLGVGLPYSTAFGIQFVVDIDGPNKGSSKLGQDVFQFTYYAHGKMLRGAAGDETVGGVPRKTYYNRCPNSGLFMGAYSPADVNGFSCTRDRNKDIASCKKNGTKSNAFPNGSGCSGLIIRDGWKISSDYPWDYAHKK